MRSSFYHYSLKLAIKHNSRLLHPAWMKLEFLRLLKRSKESPYYPNAMTHQMYRSRLDHKLERIIVSSVQFSDWTHQITSGLQNEYLIHPYTERSSAFKWLLIFVAYKSRSLSLPEYLKYGLNGPTLTLKLLVTFYDITSRDKN